MTRRPELAALFAALMLAACSESGPPPAGDTSALADEMVTADPMLAPGEIDDATGTDIP
jgi:hypothetical protein